MYTNLYVFCYSSFFNIKAFVEILNEQTACEILEIDCWIQDEYVFS